MLRDRYETSAEPTSEAAAWWATLDANLLSAVLVTTALRERLGPGGAAINLSSIAAHRGGSGSYGASKAAVEVLEPHAGPAAGVGGDHRQRDRPGCIEDTDFFGAGIAPERRAWNIEQTLNKRPGPPPTSPGTALYLASPAGSHVTGQIRHVNGGSLAGR